jgi:hypothetical protein
MVVAIEWSGVSKVSDVPSLGATQSSARPSRTCRPTGIESREQRVSAFRLKIGDPALLQAKLGTCSCPSELLGAKDRLAAPCICTGELVCSLDSSSPQRISSSFLHNRRVAGRHRRSRPALRMRLEPAEHLYVSDAAVWFTFARVHVCRHRSRFSLRTAGSRDPSRAFRSVDP